MVVSRPGAYPFTAPKFKKCILPMTPRSSQFHIFTCSFCLLQLVLWFHGRCPRRRLPSWCSSSLIMALQVLPRVVLSKRLANLLSPQWVQCDLRYFDMSVLGKFAVVMADPPWDIHMEVSCVSLLLYQSPACICVKVSSQGEQFCRILSQIAHKLTKRAPWIQLHVHYVYLYTKWNSL